MLYPKEKSLVLCNMGLGDFLGDLGGSMFGYMEMNLRFKVLYFKVCLFHKPKLNKRRVNFGIPIL